MSQRELLILLVLNCMNYSMTASQLRRACGFWLPCYGSLDHLESNTLVQRTVDKLGDGRSWFSITTLGRTLLLNELNDRKTS
jgi:hypothetical protein